MKVLAIFAISTICLTMAQDSPAAASASKKPEKRGVGLGYGLSGFGYDNALGYTAAGYHHPAAAAAGYVAPLASTTVIKSGYSAVPVASAGYTGYDLHGKYSGFYPGYTTGYSGLGYGGYAGVPVVAASSPVVGTGYGKYVQPATTTYSKVIHSYPHAAVAPAAALGYSGVTGYHGGYVY